MSRRCPGPCGKVRYRSRGHARRQLHAARQACQRAGQPEPTWPTDWYRCRHYGRWWHHYTDKETRETYLRRNLARVVELLAARAA